MDRHLKTFFLLPMRFSIYGMVILMSGLWACKTNKERKGTNFFQNVSARYNILFNGNQILDEVSKKRLLDHRDNFQSTLPIFVDPTTKDGERAAYLMDSVIQKANTLINTKDQSRFIPQAYFMMAQAQYEKTNFYQASELFRYISQTADPQDFQLKEQAYSWHARMLILSGRLNQASVSLDSAFAQARFRRKVPLSLTQATNALWLMEQGEIAGSLPFLKQAINVSKSPKERLRWQYLYAQLLEQGGAHEEAYKAFNKVANSNAAFELAFNASLRCEAIVSLHDPDIENHILRLKKLARNNKSIGFKDQIHYLIAQSYLQARDTANAITQLKISLQENVQNEFQRTGSYLALADLYFDRKQYGLAKSYYDSTASVINSSYPSYKQISEKITHVDDLTSNYLTIAREDTLRLLASMPVEQREQFIDSLISSKAAITTEQKEQVPNVNRAFASLSSPGDSDASTLANASSGNHFYFNNPTAVSTGISTFRRRWGNRPLEDDWRWSSKPNKASSRTRTPSNEAEMTGAATATNAAEEQQSLLNRADYLAAIPDDDEKWRKSDQRISNSLMEIGNLYRDVLKDPHHAMQTYEELLKRYPEASDRDATYYYLYRLYADADEQQKKNWYGQLLAEEFPKSTYTRSILDPNYLQTVRRDKAALDSLYTKTFEAYTKEDFKEVKSIVDSLQNSEEEESTQRIHAQLAYLKALAVGRTASIDEYEEELRQLSLRYPDDPLLAPIVKQQLSFIQENRDSLQSRAVAIAEINANRERFENEPNMTKWPELVYHADGQALIAEPQQEPAHVAEVKDEDNTIPALTPFKEIKTIGSNRNLDLLPDTGTYYLVIDVRLASANLSPSRYGIGQFNRSQNSTKNLRHQLMTVLDTSQLIYIGQFESYSDVKTYANRIAPLMKDIMKVPQEKYETFIITQQNLELLTDGNKLNTYIDLYNRSNP